MIAIMRGEPHTLSDTINSAGPGGVAGLAELSYLITSRLADVYQQSVVGLRVAETAPTTETGLWQVFPDGRMETTWKIRRDATTSQRSTSEQGVKWAAELARRA